MVTSQRVFLYAGEHVLPRSAQEAVEAEGLTFLPVNDGEEFVRTAQKKRPQVILVEFPTLLKFIRTLGLNNGHSLPEISYKAILVRPTQVANLHRFLSGKLMNDYIVAPANRTQLSCLVSRSERHIKALRYVDDHSLEKLVERKLTSVLDKLDFTNVTDLHSLITPQVEKPLLSLVMDKCSGNQLKAAKVLGINRNTLRKKLALLKIASP